MTKTVGDITVREYEVGKIIKLDHQEVCSFCKMPLPSGYFCIVLDGQCWCKEEHVPLRWHLKTIHKEGVGTK